MSGSSFRYTANGFTLASEIAFPELRPGTAAADVVLRYGRVPLALPAPAAQGERFQAAPGAYLLTIDGVARYGVWEGREVVVEPFPGAREDAVRTFVLSSVMGALAHQRRLLPLHASAVQVGGRCVLFAGPSGSGKSTLAATLYHRGYALLADDVSVVSLDARGRAVAHPGYAHLKLGADVLRQLPVLPGERRTLPSPLNKYSVVLQDQLVGAALPVSRLYVLGSHPGALRLSAPLPQAQRHTLIRHNTFRKKLLHPLGNSRAHFVLSDHLARQIQVRRLDRPATPFDPEALADLLESDFLR